MIDVNITGNHGGITSHKIRVHSHGIRRRILPSLKRSFQCPFLMGSDCQPDALLYLRKDLCSRAAQWQLSDAGTQTIDILTTVVH